MDGGHSVLEQEEDECSEQDSTISDPHYADSSVLSLNHTSGLDEVHYTGPQLSYIAQESENIHCFSLIKLQWILGYLAEY